MAPTISIVLKRPSNQAQQDEGLGQSGNSHAAAARPSRQTAAQSSMGTLPNSPWGGAAEESTATAVVAAAKQAVAVLEQQCFEGQQGDTFKEGKAIVQQR